MQELLENIFDAADEECPLVLMKRIAHRTTCAFVPLQLDILSLSGVRASHPSLPMTIESIISAKLLWHALPLW
eukprot:4845964-Amphidinium_carterae.1